MNTILTVPRSVCLLTWVVLAAGACAPMPGGTDNTNLNDGAGNDNATPGGGVTDPSAGNLFVVTAGTQPGTETPVALEFDGQTGEFLRTFISFDDSAQGASLSVAFGPNRNLFVAVNDQVQEYDGSTGEFLGDFLPADTGPTVANAIAFSPAGDLFVATDEDIQVFDGTTGADLDLSIAAGSGGLATPVDIAFTAQGTLLVASEMLDDQLTTSILEFDGESGAFLRTVVTPQDQRPSQIFDLEIGPQGHLYMTSVVDVLEYDGMTGAFVGTFFQGLTNLFNPNIPSALAFGPDQDLYVLTTATGGVTRILQLDGATGAQEGTFAENENIWTFGHMTFKPAE